MTKSKPAFAGFPRETLRFLRALSKNNTKKWFGQHRDDYERYYVEPAKAFVVAAGMALARSVLNVNAEPKTNRSIFRINRDVRFSADKRPYKDHLMLRFWVGDSPKTASSGLYLRLGASTLGLGCGAHMFDKARLATYRKAGGEPRAGKSLMAAVKKIRKAGFALNGEHYKKLPKGFDATGESARLLRHNGLWIGADQKVTKSLHSPGIVDHCVAEWKKMLPPHKWLVAELS